MHRQHPLVTRLTIALVTALILAGAFYQRATYNLTHIEYRNSNFVFFWLAGRMVIAGENPYDSSQWLAAHDSNNVSWRPNLIFPYPLPLAPLLAPFGALSLPSAYLAWQLISQVLIAVGIWALLVLRRQAHDRRMLIPLVLILLFFGPVYLSLQIGALGAITLCAIVAAVVLLDRGRPLLAGAMLALTLLKPPQGLPILMLASVWLVAQHRLKPIAGLGLGAIGLLVIGMLVDPLWLWKFAVAGQAVMERTFGIQSNVLGLSYHACTGVTACMWALGGAASIVLLTVGGAYLWRKGSDLTPWEAFSIIIPVAFLSTPYSWSYDQVLYVIPVIWIVVALTVRTRSYVAAFLYLLILSVVSLITLAIHAYTRSDLASLLTTLLVLGGLAGVRHPQRAVSDAIGSS